MVSLVVAALGALALFAALFPWSPGGPAFAEGSTAERPIIAPRDVEYESAVLTAQRRQEAVDAVAEVQVLDTDIRDRQLGELDRVLSQIETIRADEALSASARETAIAAIEGTDLSTRAATALSEADDTRWDFMQSEANNALSRTLTGAVGADDVGAARNRAAGLLSPQLTTDEALAITELLDPLIVPTLVVDEERTQALRQDAMAAAPVVRVAYRRGDVVVPAGETIDAAAAEAVQQLGITSTPTDLRTLLAAALTAVLAGAALGGHVWVTRSRSLRGIRRLALFVLLLVVPVAVAKLALPLLLPDYDRYFLAQALPLAASPIVAVVLLDVSSAVLLAALLAGLVGYVSVYLPVYEAGGVAAQLDTLRLVLSVGAGSLAGVYVAARADRLQHYLAAGFAVAVASAVGMLAVLLIDPERAWVDVAWIGGTALVGGLLAAMVAVGAFILLSRPFGIITRVELMELSQLSHPLMRRLQDEASGTFQHSMLVGNLAERAADRIGADPLLVRVGAYYHDIGKLVAPSFFVENYSPDENPHEHLDPLQSTRVIQQHVTAGIELGRREGLPDAVIQFIPEHHGTRLVAYFYRRAAEQNPDISPDLFRYPGPRPQSRETALVMIADACEASVRASSDRSAERIRQIVEETIGERIEEGQFDECDLSLRDLRVVAELYTSTLTAVYHPRVEYPEPTRHEMEARQARSGRAGDGASASRDGRPRGDSAEGGRASTGEEQDLVVPPERRASAQASPQERDERPLTEDDT